MSEFDWRAFPDRLNLGCGFDRREGYTNVDFQESHHPDLQADVRDLGMLPSDHYREIIAIDCLEHLPRTDTARALAEWFRLLVPGGVLRLRTPEFFGIAWMMGAAATAEEQLDVVQQLFGTQAYTGDFHQTCFTPLTMLHHLCAAGYGDASVGVLKGWLLDAEASKPQAPGLDRIGVAWHGGVYDLESSGNGSPWRWCADRGEIVLLNPGERGVRAHLHAQVEAPARRRRSTLWIEGPGRRERTAVGRTPVPLTVRISVPPGTTRLRLRTNAPAVRAKHDHRRLHLRLTDPRVEVELAAG